MRCFRRSFLSMLPLLAVITVGAALIAAAKAAAAESVLTGAELEATQTQARSAGVVESMEAVRSDGRTAIEALDPSGSESPLQGTSASPLAATVASAAVDLVVMHGHFTDAAAKRPPGTTPPSGAVMAFAVNRATGQVAALYVGDRSPQLPGGAVERRSFHTATAAATARTRRARARAATWGNNCKAAEGFHCYVESEWEMKGAGNEVLGTQSEQDTTSMNVPEWRQGAYVTNESWASDAGLPHAWTEIGQQGGEYKSCCVLWWFYAWQNSRGYMQRTAPPYVWEVAAGSYNNYSMQTNTGGVWCWLVGATFNEQKYCESDFAWAATDLQVGAEIYSETKPRFAASDYVNATWTDHTIHTWSAAEQWSNTAGLCWSANGPYHGNIFYKTC